MSPSNENERRPPYTIIGRSKSSTQITNEGEPRRLTQFRRLDERQNTGEGPVEPTSAEKQLALIKNNELINIKSTLQSKTVEIKAQKRKLKAAKDSAKIAQENLADHKTKFAEVVFGWVENRIGVLSLLEISTTACGKTSQSLYNMMEKDFMERKTQVEVNAQLKIEGKIENIVSPKHLDLDDYGIAFDLWRENNILGKQGDTVRNNRVRVYTETRDTLRKSASEAQREYASLVAHAKKLDEEVKQLQESLKCLEAQKEDPQKPKVGSSGPVNDGERRQHLKSKGATNGKAKVLPGTPSQPKIQRKPSKRTVKKVSSASGLNHASEKHSHPAEKRSQPAAKRNHTSGNLGRRGSTANTKADKRKISRTGIER